MTKKYEKEVKEAESVLEDKNLTDSEISQELIDKDNPTENVKPSEIDFLRKEPDLATQIDLTLFSYSNCCFFLSFLGQSSKVA